MKNQKTLVRSWKVANFVTGPPRPIFVMQRRHCSSHRSSHIRHAVTAAAAFYSTKSRQDMALGALSAAEALCKIFRMKG